MKTALAGALMASLALAGGTIDARGQSHLYAIRTKPDK